MVKYLRPILRPILLGILATLLVVTPALAVVYSTKLTIVESGGIDHGMLPFGFLQDNAWMVANGFMEADALDTRVETGGGIAAPHMVTTERVLAAVDVPANSNTNLRFTTGNADLTNLYIIEADNGYVQTADAATLEPANNFEIEFDGWVDVTETSVPMVYKYDGVLIDSSAVGTITAGIIDVDSYDVTPIVFAAWTDVDVSDYIPSDASGVVIEIDTTDLAKDAGYRMNGSTDNRVGGCFHHSAMVGVDSNGIFEVYLEDVNCSVYIRGYTDSNWVFNVNADNVSDDTLSTWTDIDVTAETSSDAVVAIIEVIPTGSMGFRMNGSADDRRPAVAGSLRQRVVGLDSAQIFEQYISNIATDAFLVGYATGGVAFTANGIDKSLGVSLAWTNSDCTANTSSDATFLFFETEGTSATSGIGFREEGTADAIITDFNIGPGEAIVKCDVDEVIELYEELITRSAIFLSGYSEYGVYPPFPNPTYLKSVSQAGLTSGEMTILVTADTVNLKLFIDAVEEDSVALAGASVSDNDANWRELMHAVPYAEYYTLTVSGVLQLTYQPDNMLTGSTIEDETNAFDGEIAWGDAPVAISLGSMISAGQPGLDVTGEPVRDMLPAVDTSDWFVEPDVGVGGSLLTNPMRPFVTIMSDTTNLTELQAWRILALALVLMVTVGVAIAVRGHLVIAGIACGVAIGAMTALTIFPLWALIFAIGAIFAGAVAERSPSL